MKILKRIILTALIITILMLLPAQAHAAASKYGAIITDKSNNVKLYEDLIVLSPNKYLMVKANNISKSLGLNYSYHKLTKKLTIKNPKNGKSLVFVRGQKEYTYYADASAKGSVKTALYPFYYDNSANCNVIHASTLKYIVGYTYYKNIKDPYYSQMGYQGILAYSTNGYTSKEIPITIELVNFMNAKTFTTKKSFLDAVRLNLMARNTGVTLKTNRRVMKEIGSSNSIYGIIKNLDTKDTSRDADYLTLLVDHFSQQWRSTSTVKISPDGTRKVIESEDDPASLTIDAKYETTLKQEKTVDHTIAAALKGLKLEGASDYSKVKAIHDYIIQLASYDITYQNSTAYDLLIKKSAVCEGYALVAYRMFTDAGLESRIITGYGKGEPHAWNIVKVGGRWYHIDLTWDDPITSTGKQVLRYDYFLKNTTDFKDHERNEEYLTKDFLAKYPIAAVSYDMQK